MNVHLIDGTYELFRHYFAVPSSRDRFGRERGACIGVIRSLLGMLEGGATHMAVATDHVIESFRNDLWIHYKTGEGIEPELREQFHPLEEALVSMGVVVWPLVEFEADDGLAAGAELAAADPRVETVFVCSPDKDLAQCVRGTRVVQLDRMRRTVRDEAGVIDKFGVPPRSIPDYLALVGDSADGYPGIPGWGAKSTATVLGRYERLDAIPQDEADWAVNVRGAARIARNLRDAKEAALLFRRLAVLRTDSPVSGSVDELEWRGPTPGFEAVAEALGAPELWSRARSVG
jgi:5'-3' exonuclease